MRWLLIERDSRTRWGISFLRNFYAYTWPFFRFRRNVRSIAVGNFAFREDGGRQDLDCGCTHRQWSMIRFGNASRETVINWGKMGSALFFFIAAWPFADNLICLDCPERDRMHVNYVKRRPWNAWTRQLASSVSTSIRPRSCLPSSSQTHAPADPHPYRVKVKDNPDSNNLRGKI